MTMTRSCSYLITVLLMAASLWGPLVSCGGTTTNVTTHEVNIEEIDGTTDVAVDSIFKYTFSYPVDQLTVNILTFFILSTPAAESGLAASTKGAYDASVCLIGSALEASVGCSSSTVCGLTPAANLSHGTNYTVCLTPDIAYADGTAFAGATYTFRTVSGSATLAAPSLADIRTALGANNTYGMTPGLTAGSITLPACTRGDGSELDFEVAYSISDLPSWLSFNVATRAVTLASGTAWPTVANTASSVIYTCTSVADSALTASQTLAINDLDGGGVVDGLEYANGEVPYLNPQFGYIDLTPATLPIYRTASKLVPTGIIKTSVGMSPTDAADDTADFDGDAGETGGGTNAEEIAAGTNVFVAASGASFTNAGTVETGISPPDFITIGDFNGDGILDSAVTVGGGINTLLGDGDGTFTSAGTETTGMGAKIVNAGDLNGNGRLDLAVGDTDGEIYLFAGDGTGGFADAETFNVLDSLTPYITSLADIDGDGDLDIVSLLSGGMGGGGDTVAAYFNDGNGEFDSHSTVTAGDSCYSAAVGDFDGDGDLDLAVVSNGNDLISVFLGDGFGIFGSRIDYDIGADPYGITAGDFNGDGVLDLAAANTGSDNITVLLGDGTGKFGNLEDYSVGDYPRMIVNADFDGDGDADLAVGNRDDNTISILTGAGDGTFTSGGTLTLTTPLGLAAGDLDGDGDIDLAGASSIDTTVTSFLNE